MAKASKRYELRLYIAGNTPKSNAAIRNLNTIEPKAAAQIFEDWVAPYAGQITVLKGWEPVKVLVGSGRVVGTEFDQSGKNRLTVKATLTADSTDWGDIIRLSGARYMAGPDLKSHFNEPSAPESLDVGGDLEMNPISWCPLLRETGNDSTIPRPARYDDHSFADWQKAPPWVYWDGSGGIYNMAGWCIYTHRRMIDRFHNHLAPGTEAMVLNWPAQDYPLSTLPAHVVQALEQNEPGGSRKNIVAMTSAQRRIVFEDAKRMRCRSCTGCKTGRDRMRATLTTTAEKPHWGKTEVPFIYKTTSFSARSERIWVKTGFSDIDELISDFFRVGFKERF